MPSSSLGGIFFCLSIRAACLHFAPRCRTSSQAATAGLPIA
jgi:hypothetical protein